MFFSKGRVPAGLLLLFLFVASIAHAQSNEKPDIGALGTLMPESGLIRLTGASGITISKLFVHQGDQVKQGAPVAQLSNYDLLEAELKSLQLEYQIFLTTHEHNTKILELDTANARLKLSRANTALKKYLALSKNAQVNSVRDQRYNDVADAKHILRTKETELLKEKQSFDLDKKKMELQIEKAEINLRSADIRAPLSGVVLDVPGRVGAASSFGIAVIADVSKMMVKSEVYEGDLGSVKLGQTASVSGKALSEKYTGKVVRVGREIDVARKVAIVWIELDNNEEASKFIGMEVNVSIKQ
ncbi:efflux RND transporter periplasmic adaptor subunit [Terasakiella pusilla]|uniref:efflux RND transporter periplasmic adaptor subunit n=1 Tax=Terasakiella pusilla TaxID=64973 RepID=UPI00048DECAA|nr:efflux RND transporter periplasmic adaptor subunit [Terasakiella pusilla]